MGGNNQNTKIDECDWNKYGLFYVPIGSAKKLTKNQKKQQHQLY